MLNRRQLISSGFSVLAFTVARPARAAADLNARVMQAERAIAKSLAAGRPPSAASILSSLQTEDLSPAETRVAIFELVRRVPYKLTSWKGDRVSLFALGRGDCRHKAAAAEILLKSAGMQAQHRLVTFDWVDLPIPRELLGLLTDTRSFHDTVFVDIDGKPTLYDATWDPPLYSAGFPVLDRWDGVSETLPITFGLSQVVDMAAIPKNSNLYEQFGFRWPERKKTLAFNRAFNAWSDGVRARREGVVSDSAMSTSRADPEEP